MTSSEAKSVAKRRSGGGVTSDATARHTGMFTWSAGHVNVRDLIMTQLPQIPTIVRISTGYRSELLPRRFDFHEGSLYLVRSVRFRQLVVAQTPDKNFITIPRDCPLTFHLVSNNDTLANVALTLADILGGTETGDLGPCNGQRVQLSSSQRTDYADWIPVEARGHLELKEIYKETFLLCHAFVGGTLNREQTVVPGYLPLKLNVAQSMTSGTDLGKYVLTLCQAVADYSNEYVSNDSHEIAMFTEPPVKLYEWLEPRQISEPDPNPFSTFKPSKPCQSTYVYNAPVTRALTSHNRPIFRERFSLDSKVSQRPLPPIPKEAANPQPERNDSGLYKKSRNTNVDPLRWQSRVIGAKSKPLVRCGSEPNLVGEERQPRLSSSQSLDLLDTLDAVEPQPDETRSKPTVKNAFLSLPRQCRPPPASAVATGNREPRPASHARAPTSPEDGKTAAAAAAVRPLPTPTSSPEDAVPSTRGKSTRTSTLRRQTPVSPETRRQSATYRQSSLEELISSINRPGDLYPAEDINPTIPAVATAAGASSADDGRRLRAQKPPDIELPPAAALTSAQYSIDEGYYDKIVSPTYLVMTRPSAASRTSQPSAADSITGSTAIHDGALYVNTRRLQTSSARRLVLTHQSENPSSNVVNLLQDDEDGYCMPHPYISLLKDDVRGQGVGAEEDRNLYCGPTVKSVRSTGNPSSVCSAASLLQLGSLQRVGFTSLDDVPADLSCLSVVEVLQCLRWLHLDRYVERFRAEQIDGELLMSVDQQLLVEEFDFKRFDAMKLEKFARSGWRPKEDHEPPDNCYYYQHQKPCIQLQHSPNEPLYTDV